MYYTNSISHSLLLRLLYRKCLILFLGCAHLLGHIKQIQGGNGMAPKLMIDVNEHEQRGTVIGAGSAAVSSEDI